MLETRVTYWSIAGLNDDEEFSNVSNCTNYVFSVRSCRKRDSIDFPH